MQREMRQEGALVNEYQVAEIVKEHGAVHVENLSVGPKVRCLSRSNQDIGLLA